MENYIDAPPKATFYINELACELAELFIQHTYEHTSEVIWVDDKQGGCRYSEFIQTEFDIMHDKIESYLLNNQLKK